MSAIQHIHFTCCSSYSSTTIRSHLPCAWSPNQQAKVSHAGVILDLPVQAFTACDRKETPTISSSGWDPSAPASAVGGRACACARSGWPRPPVDAAPPLAAACCPSPRRGAALWLKPPLLCFARRGPLLCSAFFWNRGAALLCFFFSWSRGEPPLVLFAL